MNSIQTTFNLDNEPQLDTFLKDFSFAANVELIVVKSHPHSSKSPICYNKEGEARTLDSDSYPQQYSAVQTIVERLADCQQTCYLDNLPFTILELKFNERLAGYIFMIHDLTIPLKWLAIHETATDAFLLQQRQRLEKLTDFFVMSSKEALKDRNSPNCLTITRKKTNEKDHTLSNEVIYAQNYINEHLNHSLYLEDVAQQVYLSKYYFCKLFKKEVGMSFVNYLKLQRIQRAKELLAYSDLKIETISKEVGFSQPSYFCKIFKGLVSVSPAYYRKSFRKNKIA
ncbi:helix-turn-helix transcriptional regulator [Enterococcus sp. 669A]|uniref:Helix-turn-helix transcriptional regulator n=1 Tax=Candidatus Enterococcus moelleringii TaxID=2815325 RepID=A0ABS3L7T9_9ENTE|nr:AraC family transcriptional regulator [Enterococcus sp. 669A]MBO1305675.1 helix-turn-helix transcriptional regulator [Enterococcus sp. 669A]